MSKNILLLSNRDFLTLPIIRSLDRNKYRIFVMGPLASSVRFSRYCTRYFSYPRCTESNRDDILVEYINNQSRKYIIDAIIPLDLETTLWIAENAHRLHTASLPVSNVDVLLRLHDKWEITKVLDKLRLPYPKTVLIENREHLIPGIIEYPFMVKPLNLEAGKGIVRIDNDDDLARYRETSAGHNSYPILAQQYIHGLDVGMSAIAVEGKIIAWTTQKHIRAGTLELMANEEVYDIGEKIIKEENYSGFMHIDLQMDSLTQEVFVLECNPRTWSSMNASMLAGANFIEYAVDSALHRSVETTKIPNETYLTFQKSVMILLTKPWKLRELSSITKRDLSSALTDPIPYVLLAIVQCVKRIFLAVKN